MTDCIQTSFDFPACKSRKITADFAGGDITSDGGSLLLRQIDRRLKLTNRLARLLKDPRDQQRCDHTMEQMLRQRVYGLALGYEDLNDHDELRHDLGLQTSVDRLKPLASSPTLCRFENRADREAARMAHQIIVELFIESFKTPPKELILDFDATDDPVHGKQQGRFFHGYYDHYCFLPLYVFCGSQLLVSYLRPSNIDGAKHAWAILSLLVKRFREEWPDVKIIMRADSGFCRWRMLRWCEKHRVHYLIGIAKNSRLNQMASNLITQAREEYEKTREKQRLFDVVQYAALCWDHPRRVIAKAEHGSQGSNPRYVVTNLDGAPQDLYEKIYCARGDMENRIKEQQLDLFADRTSCSAWWPNQFRLLLSSLAYILVEAIRRLALIETQWARAQCGTIRLKLLKVGGIVLRNTRRIRLHLSSAYPYQDDFRLIAERLARE